MELPEWQEWLQNLKQYMAFPADKLEPFLQHYRDWLVHAEAMKRKRAAEWAERQGGEEQEGEEDGDGQVEEGGEEGEEGEGGRGGRGRGGRRGWGRGGRGRQGGREPWWKKRRQGGGGRGG